MTDNILDPMVEPRTPAILVIDDDPNNLAVISEYLKECNYTILVAEDGKSGLERAVFTRPDLILLDVLMPRMDGFQTCRMLRKQKKTKDIPVVLMTALAETEHKVRGFEAGAVDYITKPFQREELLARVSVHLRIGELTARLREANELLERRVEARTAELMNSERRLMDIINFLPDATFAIDLQGKVIIWNRTAEHVTGALAEEMIGKGNREYAVPFYGERRPALIDLVLNPSPEILKLYPYVTMKDGMVRGESYTRSIQRGESYMMGIAAPLYDSEGRLAGAIESVRDITEHKKLEEQLRHAQKMEAIGILAGGVAHDFNNILTAIIGYAMLIRLKLGGDHPLAAYAADILAASENAACLTKSLLAFSRKQVISTRLENLNDIVRRIDKFLLRIIGEHIEFKVATCEQDLVVMADPAQIEQVLMNLAVNSRDAMPEGGTLAITTARVDIGAQSADTFLEPGPYAVLSVSDTGAGMDEDVRERIFEPFFTTKEVGKGTGLGLSIVYGIVKQHNGEIQVISEPGKGTTFKIYLKLEDAEAGSEEPVEPAHPVGGAETILVAEDNDEVRKLIVHVLQEYGYTVIQAADGEDAVAKFAANKESIQLVVSDVVMPKKDGRAAYEEMEEIRPGVPVLFTSGYNGQTAARKGKKGQKGPPACCLHFIPKPLTPQALLAKIRQILS